jgi:hypothetical protein
MIICPFSSSHFATLIFPIDELRIVEAIPIIENYVLNPTFICKLTIFIVSLSFILYKTIQGISRVIITFFAYAFSFHHLFPPSHLFLSLMTTALKFLSLGGVYPSLRGVQSAFEVF